MSHFLAIVRGILTLRDIERCPTFNFLVLAGGGGVFVLGWVFVYFGFCCFGFFVWIALGFVCMCLPFFVLLLCLVLGSFGGFLFCFFSCFCLADLGVCSFFLLLFFFSPKVAKQVRYTPHHCNS